MFVGTGLIVIPLIIGLGPAPVATGIAIGGVVVALALAGTESSGRGTLPVAAQAVYDRGVALGLLLVALVFAIGGEPRGRAGLRHHAAWRPWWSPRSPATAARPA